MIRLFAALSLTPEVVARLEGLQSGLSGWRLSAPSNFHVTLAFFGEIDQQSAQDVESELSQIDANGFDLWLDGVDIFGGPRPRIAYAAVRPEVQLSALRDKVRQAGRRAGLDLRAERYVPHVTLGRGGTKADQRLTRWLTAGAPFIAGPVPITKFGLFRSDLGRAGPIYTELASYQLAAR